ncbi:NAD(P)-binding protein [Nonomuraea jiangxiensis]|uniref:NAD(P)-binding protein n=1 Tax=Nonomuraea jiangxiensis TaxID=633440 RepID=UPI000B84F573|nr:NAD(P)-binding protein [Nonomuraea jiangxiensis]
MRHRMQGRDGAGIAGLTAAHRLAGAGIEVTVLEAGCRPGGLMSTLGLDTAIRGSLPGSRSSSRISRGCSSTPIWQEPHFLACKDATVRRVDPYTPVLRRTGCRTSTSITGGGHRQGRRVYRVQRARSPGETGSCSRRLPRQGRTPPTDRADP